MIIKDERPTNNTYNKYEYVGRVKIAFDGTACFKVNHHNRRSDFTRNIAFMPTASQDWDFLLWRERDTGMALLVGTASDWDNSVVVFKAADVTVLPLCNTISEIAPHHNEFYNEIIDHIMMNLNFDIARRFNIK